MVNSLFGKPKGIKVGQKWVDLALEKDGTPHPMMRVKVKEVDDVGMVVLCSAPYGTSDLDIQIAPDTLLEKYRLDEDVK